LSLLGCVKKRKYRERYHKLLGDILIARNEYGKRRHPFTVFLYAMTRLNASKIISQIPHKYIDKFLKKCYVNYGW